MPWSPTPTVPAAVTRPGWSPTGPPAPTITPRPGWFVVQQAAGSDDAHGDDLAALLAHLAATDPALSTDTAAALLHLAGADTGAGGDTSTLLAHLNAVDTGISTDAATWIEHWWVSFTDEHTSTDTAALLAHLAASDLATGADAAPVFAHLALADQNAGVDTARPTYMLPYSGSKAATTVPHATWTDLLTYTAVGNGDATVTFSVSHSWGSNAFHFGENRGMRILVGGTQVAVQMQNNYGGQSWNTTLTQASVNVPGGASVQIQGYAETTFYTACRTVTISAASMTVNSVA